MDRDSKERIAVAQAYPGRKWQDKVKLMTEEQVVAIYKRLIHQGVLK